MTEDIPEGDEVARHPLGFPLASGAQSCATCGWHHLGGRGRAVDRCRQADDARVEPTWPACDRWEPELDCQECGACCRSAYDSVTISKRERVVAKYPQLVSFCGTYVEVCRDGDHCVALAGDGRDERFACQVYEIRPRPCREFERGGSHCLVARRRVLFTK